MEQALQHFQLQLFPNGAELKDQRITGSLVRNAETLLIKYRVEGDLASLRWPAPVPLPSRCHGLWQSTCFEFFVSTRGEPGYWEVNCSPNGCWNVYRFNAYREEMVEEASAKTLCCSVSEDSNGLDLSCRLETSGMIEKSCTLEIGVSAVLQHRTDELQYWALCHPGLKADFHDRRSFTIKMVAVAD